MTPRQRCIYAQARQLSRAVSSHYDAELGKVGLKTSQFALMRAISSAWPVRPKDLAVAAGLDPSTLTRNLKPLVASGWVNVTEGSDGRSRCVQLTRSGEVKLFESEAHWLRAQDTLERLIGAACVASFDGVVDQYIAALRRTS